MGTKRPHPAGCTMMPTACVKRLSIAPAFLAGLALLVGTRSLPAVAGEPWPQAPFGTPPSFSQAYPHPLYPTGRFIPLPQLVREHKPVETRGSATADGRAEAFAALQKLAPRGDVGPPESALAYGPAQISPQLGEPQEARLGGRPRARIRHPKPAPVHPARAVPGHPTAVAPSHPANAAPAHPARPAAVPPARPAAAHFAQHRERHRSALPPPLNILPPAARMQ
jgi:hypothetical protein